MNPDLTQLKVDIAEFEKFKEKLDIKELNYPLDKISLDLIHKDIVIQQGAIYAYNTYTYNDSQQININGKIYTIATSSII